jgi:hypothetical protein
MVLYSSSPVSTVPPYVSDYQTPFDPISVLNLDPNGESGNWEALVGLTVTVQLEGTKRAKAFKLVCAFVRAHWLLGLEVSFLLC